MNRRDMLKSTLAATALVTTGLWTMKKAQAAYTTITLEECLAMSPEAMAKSSGEVMNSWNYLLTTASEIREPFIRQTVIDIISNPAPTVVKACNEQEALKELKAAGYVKEEATSFLPPLKSPDKALQPFLSATGSGWTSHHSYPGGLATHTAFNTQMAVSMQENYKNIYSFDADKDIVIAAQILHDLHKPWVFQWNENNQCRAEEPLAGSGQHHVLSLAESIHRGLPAKLIIAQAGAHNPPSSPDLEAQVVNWLKAASIIAGKDPVKLELIAQDGKTLPLPRNVEAFITHVADHDYVLSVPCVQWLIPVLKSVAEQNYQIKGQDLEGKPFNSFRNYVLSQGTAMNLYNHYALYGQQGLSQRVAELIKL